MDEKRVSLISTMSWEAHSSKRSFDARREKAALATQEKANVPS